MRKRKSRKKCTTSWRSVVRFANFLRAMRRNSRKYSPIAFSFRLIPCGALVNLQVRDDDPTDRFSLPCNNRAQSSSLQLGVGDQQRCDCFSRSELAIWRALFLGLLRAVRHREDADRNAAYILQNLTSKLLQLPSVRLQALRGSGPSSVRNFTMCLLSDWNR